MPAPGVERPGSSREVGISSHSRQLEIAAHPGPFTLCSAPAGLDAECVRFIVCELACPPRQFRGAGFLRLAFTPQVQGSPPWPIPAHPPPIAFSTPLPIPPCVLPASPALTSGATLRLYLGPIRAAVVFVCAMCPCRLHADPLHPASENGLWKKPARNNFNPDFVVALKG
jgi:hypothetical protein